MRSKNKIDKEFFYHSFEAGDLCSSQNKNLYVILGIRDGKYEFMHLQEESFNTLNAGRIVIKKGDIVTQPCDIFDKHHLLYQK